MALIGRLANRGLMTPADMSVVGFELMHGEIPDFLWKQ
jgi:hypothetical protein